MGLYKAIYGIAKEKGLAISHIEDELNITGLRSWEIHGPNVWKLKKVADLLGVTVDDLLTRSKENEGKADS